MKHIKLLAVLFISTLTIISCSDNETIPVVINAEEVITTMTIELTPMGGGDKITLQSKDADGDGPTAPVITGGTLAANTTYNAVITLLNELKKPAENITEEVAKEADEHQFFYSANGVSSTFTYAGTNDANGNPVGIKFTIATGAAGTGKYIITLRHEPNKSAAGVKSGDITNAGGSTDIQASFPITVQ